MIGLVLVGGVGLMWGLRTLAQWIARHGDATVGDEAQAWLDRQRRS